MLNVLIRNESTGEEWLEMSTLKREKDVLEHYRQHRIYPSLQDGLRRGDPITITVLARPASLTVCENLHRIYNESRR